MQLFETEKLVYFAVEHDSQMPDFCPNFPFKALVIADEFDEQTTEWTWIIDFYNPQNRLPILEKFLDKLAKSSRYR